MDKAILVINMPSCCRECFALDDDCDYPRCRITNEQKGYTFRTGEQKMDKCPLKPIPEKRLEWFDDSDYERGYNDCLHEIIDD